MPGSAAAAMAMKRKRNAEKNKDKEAAGPRAAAVLEEGERTSHPHTLPGLPLWARVHWRRTGGTNHVYIRSQGAGYDTGLTILITPAEKSEEQAEKEIQKALAAKAKSKVRVETALMCCYDAAHVFGRADPPVRGHRKMLSSSCKRWPCTYFGCCALRAQFT